MRKREIRTGRESSKVTRFCISRERGGRGGEEVGGREHKEGEKKEGEMRGREMRGKKRGDTSRKHHKYRCIQPPMHGPCR